MAKKPELLEKLNQMFEKGKINRRQFIQLASVAGLVSLLPGKLKADEIISNSPYTTVRDFEVDPTTVDMTVRAKDLGIETVWDRYIRNTTPKDAGATCLMCQQGPCLNVKTTGVCGASKDVIVCKNLLGETARGAAAHVAHARRITKILKEIGDGSTTKYQIKESEKLAKLAQSLGCENDPTEVAATIQNDLSSLEGTPRMLQGKARPERQAKWKEKGILLQNGGCPEIMEAENSLAMGMDADVENMLLRACRLGLVDAYCGMYVATSIQDILLGIPELQYIKTNLSVIDKNKINIIVHGHIPAISESLIAAAEYYNSYYPYVNGGAEINIVGMCCTGQEVLMRHGLPYAGDILQQELAIATGAVELMVVDIQCTQPAVVEAVKAAGFHTKIVTTDPYAKIEGAEYIEFDPREASIYANSLIYMAHNNYKQRVESKVHIPDIEPSRMLGGFSTETLLNVLDNVKPGDPLGALVDQIKNGNIRGVAAVIGCVSPREKYYGYRTVELIKELIKNDILVILTGCVATVASYHGLLKLPEYDFSDYPEVGNGLKAVMQVIADSNRPADPDGIGLPDEPGVPYGKAVPPCIFMGACVDNSRIEEILNALADYLGIRIDQLPVAASSPEYIAEKAVPIGFWAVDLGVFTHLGDPPNVSASERVVKWLTEDVENIFGGKFYVNADPYTSAEKMIEVINSKRSNLGLEI